MKQDMFFKKPVIVRLHEYYFRWKPGIGVRDAVMELDRAKAHIKHFKKAYRKIAYGVWLEETKSLFACMVCEEMDPNALIFHHLGEEYTGLQKIDSISNMVRKQLPLYRIVDEMSKCAMLCASCHQKYGKGGKEALEDLYYMSERCYGEYYVPGDECEDIASSSLQYACEYGF